MSSRFLSLSLAVTLTALGFASSTPAAPEREAPELRSGPYEVDSGHSMVIFSIRHAGVANFYGRFNKVQGHVQLDAEALSESSVVIEIDPSSVDSNSNGRNEHIESKDFLNTAEHTELSFRSARVKSVGEGRLEVSGPLTVAGMTKTVTVPVEVIGSADTMFGDYRLGLEARFSIDRREFGMTALQGGLGEEIHFIVALETILQAEEG